MTDHRTYRQGMVHSELASAAEARSEWARGLADTDLAVATGGFRRLLAGGTSFEIVAADALACGAEAARRALGWTVDDTQLSVAAGLVTDVVVQTMPITHERDAVVPMAMAAYVRCLAAPTVHIMVNSDARSRLYHHDLAPVLELLSVRSGHLAGAASYEERRQVMAMDVVWGAFVTFSLDYTEEVYLKGGDASARGDNAAIVWDVNLFLTDGIFDFAGQRVRMEEEVEHFTRIARQAENLVRERHYTMAENMMPWEFGPAITLTPEGARAMVEEMPEYEDPSDIELLLLRRDLFEALWAKDAYQRGVDYEVEGGAVRIVGGQGGQGGQGGHRMVERWFGGGTRQAIEAREGLQVTDREVLLGPTLAEYAQLYGSLCGISSGAQPITRILRELYGLSVVDVRDSAEAAALSYPPSPPPELIEHAIRFHRWRAVANRGRDELWAMHRAAQVGGPALTKVVEDLITGYGRQLNRRRRIPPAAEVTAALEAIAAGLGKQLLRPPAPATSVGQSVSDPPELRRLEGEEGARMVAMFHHRSRAFTQDELLALKQRSVRNATENTLFDLLSANDAILTVMWPDRFDEYEHAITELWRETRDELDYETGGHLIAMIATRPVGFNG